MPFHSVTFGDKFLQSAVNVYTQRYLCSHPTILMTFLSELVDGAATTPEIRCHETAQLPRGNSGRYWEAKICQGFGLQASKVRTNSRDNKAGNVGITAFIDHPMPGIT